MSDALNRLEAVGTSPPGSEPEGVVLLRRVSQLLAERPGSRSALVKLLSLLEEYFDSPMTVFEVEPAFARLRLAVPWRADEFVDYVGLKVDAPREEVFARVRGTELTLFRLNERLLIGVRDLDRLSPQDDELLQRVGAAVRVACETYRQTRFGRWLNRRVRANQRLLDGLVNIGDTAIPWQVIAREARVLTGAHSALVLEVTTNAARVAAAIGETLRQPGDVIDRTAGLLAWVTSHQEAVLIGSLADRAGMPAAALAAVRGETDNDSAVVAPIFDHTATLVALVAVFSPTPYRFTLDDLETVGELARFAGAIVAQRQTLNFVAPGHARAGLAAEVLDLMLDGVAVVDDNQEIALHNRAFAQLHGGSHRQSLRGTKASDLEGEHLRDVGEHGALVEEERRRLDGSIFLAESYRRRFVDPVSGTAGTLIAIRDIHERALERQRVRQLAHVDPLTGLNNRAGFFDLAAEHFKSVEDGPVGLLFIDVDGLKVVNDQFGHVAGDRVLVEVASRIRKSMRPFDVIGRIGGDEFAVLVIGQDSLRVIRQVSERLSAAIAFNPVTIGTVELRITAAVGIATGTTSTFDLDQLMSIADSAMYQDKFSRRRPDLLHLHRGTRDAVEIELGPDLVRVLRGDERGGSLILRFQPIFGAESRAVTAVEALVRWQHPTEGLLLPGRFLSLALQYRLMDQLDAFVRAEAIARFARWRAAGLGLSMRLSINLSGVNAAEGRTVRDFCQLAERLGVPPSMVMIELTETELSDLLIDRIAKIMRRLKREGFLIALDDFGVGTSSFRHLQIMPVDIVKIDRQFVKDLGSGGDRGLVAGLTALAGELGISVVAEGVGDQACLDALIELGVPEVQGFHLARPLREAALLKLLGNEGTTRLG